MATPRAIGDYGGPKADATPVSNPTSQVAATEWNREAEDLAQLTRTSNRSIIKFTTVAAGNPPANTVFQRSHWGTGDTGKPTITRTGAGAYTLTFGASFVDALSETENISFFGGRVSCYGTNPLDILTGRIISIASNVVSIQVYAAGAAADVGNSSAAAFGVLVDFS